MEAEEPLGAENQLREVDHQVWNYAGCSLNPAANTLPVCSIGKLQTLSSNSGGYYEFWKKFFFSCGSTS